VELVAGPMIKPELAAAISRSPASVGTFLPLSFRRCASIQRPNPTPTAPTTIPTSPNTEVRPYPAGPMNPWISILAGGDQQSSVACCGGSGSELFPLRTLVICPALDQHANSG